VAAAKQADTEKRRVSSDYKLSEQARGERAERIRRLNADPQFAAERSERMKRLHADPFFAAKQAAGASKNMKRLWVDPEFREKASNRMKRLRAEGKLRQSSLRAAVFPIPEKVKFRD
jgi:hypothetical protein